MKHITIIAEAGVNHNGELQLAKKLAYEAHEAGADIVKYQTAQLNELVSKRAEMAEYQKKNIGTDESQVDMLKKLLLTFDEFDELFDYCNEIGIVPLSTPFDIKSIKYLSEKNMPFWKIPSGEITNLPYLLAIAETGKPVVMSTGMSDLTEVEAAVKVLQDNGVKDITLLQCNTEYPTPFEDVNLNAMLTMKEQFGLPVGYSDHTRGIEISLAAAAMGAEVIEKHFTLDRNMEGPDHKASLEPDELKKMVTCIRDIEKAMGNGEKVPSPSEIKNKDIARKSIIAKCNICKGELFTEQNITTKRPGNGVSPMKWFDVLGTRAIRDFEEDELIEI